jgi:hypothetical protein
LCQVIAENSSLAASKLSLPWKKENLAHALHQNLFLKLNFKVKKNGENLELVLQKKERKKLVFFEQVFPFSFFLCVRQRMTSRMFDHSIL